MGSILQTTNGDTLTSLILLAASVRDVPGEAAECGVLQGGTLRALSMAMPDKKILGFDTFNGMPATSWSDGEVHNVGDFAETSLETALNIIGRININWCPVFSRHVPTVRCWKFASLCRLRPVPGNAGDRLLAAHGAGRHMVFDDHDCLNVPVSNTPLRTAICRSRYRVPIKLSAASLEPAHDPQG
jgi:hypothetical protein